MNYTKFVGLDVHKSPISVGVAYSHSEHVEYLGTIPNTPDSIVSLVKRLGDLKRVQICYEAGPCGYGIYRQLTDLAINCVVVAPSLIPTKPGEHIKPINVTLKS